jgi:hypothetical protein
MVVIGLLLVDLHKRGRRGLRGTSGSGWSWSTLSGKHVGKRDRHAAFLYGGFSPAKPIRILIGPSAMSVTASQLVASGCAESRFLTRILSRPHPRLIEAFTYRFARSSPLTAFRRGRVSPPSRGVVLGSAWDLGSVSRCFLLLLIWGKTLILQGCKRHRIAGMRKLVPCNIRARGQKHR